MKYIDVYKAIIIDDETRPREVLSLKIKDLCPELEILGTADSAAKGYSLCMELRPQIVFLDVNMPSESGFDFLAKFEKIDFEIIFSTAYQEYALEAFKVAAVGYLLKPVNNEDLKAAVDIAIKQLTLKNSESKISTLLSNIKSPSLENKKLVIPSTDRYEFVNIDQIILCESSDKYTFIYTESGQKILSSQYLGWYKSILEAHGFFVPHKSYIINLKFINSLTHEDEILMKLTDVRVPLARRRKAEFLQAISLN